MKTYDIFYYDEHGNLIDETNVDEKSFELALELAEEFKIKNKVWKIEIEETFDDD